MHEITLFIKDNIDTAFLLTGVNLLLRNQQESIKRLNEMPKSIVEKELDKAVEEYDRLMTLEAQLIHILKGEKDASKKS